MKVKFIYRSEEECERCDYQGAIRIEVDGKVMFKVHDGEPEDNNLGRNFSDCYNIADLMLAAYRAGHHGFEYDVETIETDDI